MNYINTITLEYPLSQYQIKQAHPNTSFPLPFEPVEGYAVVQPSTQPAHDAMTERAVEVAPVLEGGTWFQAWEVVPLSDAEVQAVISVKVFEYTSALTQHLDAVAQSRRYDNRISFMARAGFPGPFQAEAIAFATWADTCNALGYELLAQVLRGEQPMPTVSEFLALLPVVEWPQ